MVELPWRGPSVMAQDMMIRCNSSCMIVWSDDSYVIYDIRWLLLHVLLRLIINGLEFVPYGMYTCMECSLTCFYGINFNFKMSWITLNLPSFDICLSINLVFQFHGGLNPRQFCTGYQLISRVCFGEEIPRDPPSYWIFSNTPWKQHYQWHLIPVPPIWPNSSIVSSSIDKIANLWQ